MRTKSLTRAFREEGASRSRAAEPETAFRSPAGGAFEEEEERDEAFEPEGADEFLEASIAGAMPVRTKLEISDPGDELEREADRVAEDVVAAPEGERVEVKRQPATSSGGGEASPAAAKAVGALRGGGAPLSDSARSFFELRMGVDLGDVRVHTGPAAAEAASSIKAQAFTYGRDIAFGEGKWSPDTPAGRKLLAHELAHSQQNNISSGRISREEEGSGERADVCGDIEAEIASILDGPPETPIEASIPYPPDEMLALNNYLLKIRIYYPERKEQAIEVLNNYFPCEGELIWDLSCFIIADEKTREIVAGRIPLRLVCIDMSPAVGDIHGVPNRRPDASRLAEGINAIVAPEETPNDYSGFILRVDVNGFTEENGVLDIVRRTHEITGQLISVLHVFSHYHRGIDLDQYPPDEEREPTEEEEYERYREIERNLVSLTSHLADGFQLVFHGCDVTGGEHLPRLAKLLILALLQGKSGEIYGHPGKSMAGKPTTPASRVTLRESAELQSLVEELIGLDISQVDLRTISSETLLRLVTNERLRNLSEVLTRHYIEMWRDHPSEK